MSAVHERQRGGRRSAMTAGGTMSLVEHLSELRRRLFISAAALVVGMVIGFIFYPQIFHVVQAPYCHIASVRREEIDGHCRLNAIGVLDPFKIRLRISFFTALVLAAPVWLYQLWAFITPGLHQHERRWSLAFVLASISLFGAGGALAYLVLPTSLGALLGFSGHNTLTNLVTVDSYLQYLQAMLLVFGVAFEFPLVVIMLCAVGVLTGRRLLSWWRPMVFAITVFTAVAVPSPDPFSMLLLAVPLVILFFLSVGVCRLIDRARERKRAEEDRRISAELGIDVASLTVPFVDVELE